MDKSRTDEASFQQQVGIFTSAKSLERTTYLIWRKLQRQGYGRVRSVKPPSLLTPDY